MRCVDGRTKPKLWEAAKKRAVARLGGRFSARAMQLAAKLYRDAGGAYCGRKTPQQKATTRWTQERWKTAPGAPKKACRREGGKTARDRYLPAKAWETLKAGEVRATRQKKLRGTRQWVANTGAAARAGRRARGAR